MSETQQTQQKKQRDKKASEDSSMVRWMWEWAKSIAVAFLLFLFVRAFVVEAFQIPTASMENTLLVGDFLLVNKMVYGAEIPGTAVRLPGFKAPNRFDVVVFEPPTEANQRPNTNYVKRIVGLPGDTISMQDGVLRVNGTRRDEPWAKHTRSFEDPYSRQFEWQRPYLLENGRKAREYRPTRDNWGPIQVPADSYFVMGDNRDNSEDSRYWGFVPRDAIKGTPLLIYYSFDRTKLAPLPMLTEIRWNRLLKSVD